MSLYYQGRVSEGVHAFRNALRVGLNESQCVSKEHIAWIRTNLAGALIRLHQADEALKLCDTAVDESVEHLPGYYVALCACDSLRDSHQMAVWMGRVIQLLKTNEASLLRLEQFLDRAADDPDLSWARGQIHWQEFIKTLQLIVEQGPLSKKEEQEPQLGKG